ncbi:putative inorganic phosphate cotransporter [Lycorma delicatula]|uniref:putative inorganic phosphate cotransporter n=1 Tax=Lycorma delicatula TaxID=130591 RepID=UPI003F50DDF8
MDLQIDPGLPEMAGSQTQDLEYELTQFLTSHSENIGVVIAMALSGLILGNIENSWALTFYLYGFTMINLPPIPLKSMAKSPALWGSLIAHFGHDWGIISITSDLPKYMKYVLHYDIEHNGLLSALPFMIVSITAVLGGWLSDFLHRRKLTSTSTSRKLLATISSVGPALGLTGVIYAGCNKAVSVLMLTIGMGLMGFFYSSLGINPTDLSSNYAGTVMGIIGYGTASGIFSPYITGIITKHHTLSEWHTAFGISIAMLTVTDLIFVLIGSGEIQPWDEPT